LAKYSFWFFKLKYSLKLSILLIIFPEKLLVDDIIEVR